METTGVAQMTHFIKMLSACWFNNFKTKASGLLFGVLLNNFSSFLASRWYYSRNDFVAVFIPVLVSMMETFARN